MSWQALAVLQTAVSLTAMLAVVGLAYAWRIRLIHRTDAESQAEPQHSPLKYLPREPQYMPEHFDAHTDSSMAVTVIPSPVTAQRSRVSTVVFHDVRAMTDDMEAQMMHFEGTLHSTG
ncbi:hypothetical protein [Umezawaea sp. Da 62-37]|uniref:hypothetical protein n=1 Tax=Umezawaea sp. Da 62-37 TaxID=3075927 RepID=UPI0028F6FE06|nr:hypothetical protein [Umezawaea sp. Da 62-37]WNV82250.1 hypothetical protein RM788_29030 [Umezawaea sp. Da 62-37]